MTAHEHPCDIHPPWLHLNGSINILESIEFRDWDQELVPRRHTEELGGRVKQSKMKRQFRQIIKTGTS